MILVFIFLPTIFLPRINLAENLGLFKSIEFHRNSIVQVEKIVVPRRPGVKLVSVQSCCPILNFFANEVLKFRRPLVEGICGDKRTFNAIEFRLIPWAKDRISVNISQDPCQI